MLAKTTQNLHTRDTLILKEVMDTSMETIIALLMVTTITVITIMEDPQGLYRMVSTMEMARIATIMRPRGISVKYYVLDARKRGIMLTNAQKRNSRTIPTFSPRKTLAR